MFKDFFNSINLNWQTIILIAIIVITFEASEYVIGYQKRKAVSYTLMTLLNDMATLTNKNGYKSWVNYIYDTYGKDKGELYLNQIYLALDKNKIKDPRYAEVKNGLKKLIVSEHNKNKKKEGK